MCSHLSTQKLRRIRDLTKNSCRAVYSPNNLVTPALKSAALPVPQHVKEVATMKSNALVAPYGYRPHGVSAAFQGMQAIKTVPQQARPFPSALQRVTDS